MAIDRTTGKPVIETADQTDIDASSTGLDTSRIHGRAVRSGYTGYLLGDGFPPNGYEFGHGITFPADPYVNDYFLRTDFAPNRLFRYDGKRWIKVEDAIRHTFTNTDANFATPRGAFDPTISYVINDLINYGTVQYIAVAPSLNKNPIDHPTFWRVVRTTQKTGFINNTNVNIINGEAVPERQALSKVLRPKADL